MKTDTNGEDADAKSAADITTGHTGHIDDTEAQLPPSGGAKTSNSATGSIRFGATTRRRSSIQRRVSLLRRHYSRADRSTSLQGETVNEVLGDMAHAMADNEDLALHNAKLSLKLSKMGIKLLILVSLLALLAVATGVTSYFAINDSKTSIQGSIADSVVTKVEVDGTGSAHLTDKDGRDMSVRATGDLYSARFVEDGTRQRTLYCLSVEDAAGMAHSIASGSDVHLALMDKSGSLEKEILSLSGDFQDSEDTLHFGSGKIHVHLDDNSCNDASANENLSSRGLEEQPSPQVMQSDVLARNREIYTKSRSALKDGQRVLEGESSSVPVTTDASSNTCPLTGAPPQDSNADDYTFKKAQWMSNFKPCGWYKEHCSELANVIVIEANVDYPPGADGENDADDDLVKGDKYIVQFDVGIHPSMVEAAHEPYAKFFAPEGQESVIRLSNGFDLTNPDFIAGSPGYVVGETCLEVYTQVSIGNTIGNRQDNDGDWGTIHGNNYNCMGKCADGCKGAGYARDCMKHDVCGAFVSVAKGIESSGNCMDVDCGDEQMQTVSHCHKNGKPVICNQEDQDQKFKLTFGAHFFGGIPHIGQHHEAACFLWTGWEHGQGTPSGLHKIDDGCPSKTHCESRRCDGPLWGKICMEPKENGDRCDEDSDCISGNCELTWTWSGAKCKDP